MVKLFLGHSLNKKCFQWVLDLFSKHLLLYVPSSILIGNGETSLAKGGLISL